MGYIEEIETNMDAYYLQEHISVVLRKVMTTDVELIWLQIHCTYSKPILVGCCYRPAGTNVNYLD